MRGLVRQDAGRPLPPRHAFPQMARRQEAPRMHLRPARLTFAVAAVLTLLGAACTGGSQPPTAPRQHSPIVSPTAPPSPSPTEVPPTLSPSASVTPRQASATIVVRLGAPIDRLAADQGVVYSPGQVDNNGVAKVMRFDRR